MKNICKLISASQYDGLTIPCFVLETDKNVITDLTVLDCSRVTLVTHGEATFIFDDMRVPVQTGALVFGFAGERFTAENVKDCEYIYISFDGPRTDELLRRSGINTRHRYFRDFDGLIPLWHESLSRASTEAADLAAESMLLYTFSRLCDRTCTPEDGIADKIAEIAEENFTEPDLSLGSVAAKLGYNTKYLSHIFKKKMGIGFSEYLRVLRIKHAVSLFDYGINSVKNAAVLSGFSDPLYFSSVFKKTVGVSPSEYILRRKEEQDNKS